MGAKYSGMGRADDRGLQAVQENIQVLQSEMNRLQSAIENSSTVAGPQEDNQVELNSLRKRHERLRWEFDHLKIPESEGGGDTYGSYFDLAYPSILTDTADANYEDFVDIGAGLARWPIFEELDAEAIQIDTTEDGVHYIYLRATRWGETDQLVFTYEENTFVAEDKYDDTSFLIGQVTVTDSSIDKTSLVQHQFGPLRDPAVNKEVRYRGQFAVYHSILERTVYVNPGSIRGEQLGVGGDETLAQFPEVEATYYLVCDVLVLDGLPISSLSYFASPNYPTNLDGGSTFLLATIDVGVVTDTDGSDVYIIEDIRQEHHGEIVLSTEIPGAVVNEHLFRLVTTRDGSEGTRTVRVKPGRFIYGSKYLNLPEIELGFSDVAAIYIVSLEIWYDSSSVLPQYQYVRSSSPAPPSVTKEVVRIGAVKVAGGLITKLYQYQFGEFHSTRIWD